MAVILVLITFFDNNVFKMRFYVVVIESTRETAASLTLETFHNK